MRLGLALSLGALAGISVAFIGALLFRRPERGQRASAGGTEPSSSDHPAARSTLREITSSRGFRSDFLIGLLFFCLSSLVAYLLAAYVG